MERLVIIDVFNCMANYSCSLDGVNVISARTETDHFYAVTSQFFMHQFSNNNM